MLPKPAEGARQSRARIGHRRHSQLVHAKQYMYIFLYLFAISKRPLRQHAVAQNRAEHLSMPYRGSIARTALR